MNSLQNFFSKKNEVVQGICIALVIIVLFASGNIVGSLTAVNKVEETTAAPVVQQTTAAPVVQQTTAAPVVQQTTAAPVVEETTAAPSGDTQETTAAPSGDTSSAMPTEKADIIKFYCDAYNKISEASSVTRTYDYTSNYNNIVNVNNNDKLKDLASSLMTKFMVENAEPVASDHSSLPPVGTTTLNIDPSLISNATCTDQGTYYEVTLYSTGTDDNYEIDSQPGTGSAGSIGPLLRSEDVTGAAGSIVQFEGLHSWYATAQVTAKVDKASGRITDLEFKTPCILHFDKVKALVVVSIENCEIGLLFHQKYTIAY